MVTRPAGGCDFVMTVHLNWVICRLASFIIAGVMLIAAGVLLVWMFSAFHFLRIIFLNFNLILFIECFWYVASPITAPQSGQLPPPL